MVFIIPNEADALFAPQSAPDRVDFDILTASENGVGVASGCAVTAAAAGGMAVDVAAGVISIGGGTVAVNAVTTLAVGAAQAADRKDIVVANNAGVVSVVAGAPAGAVNGTTPTGQRDPAKAAIPANSVVLAEVYVAASTAAIAAGNIIDKRALLQVVTGTTAPTNPQVGQLWVDENDPGPYAESITRIGSAVQAPFGIKVELYTGGTTFLPWQGGTLVGEYVETERASWGDNSGPLIANRQFGPAAGFDPATTTMFGAILNCTITPTANGTYAFGTHSDDGSSVSISPDNGATWTTVANNNLGVGQGTNAAIVSGTYAMSGGTDYWLQVQWGQGSGGWSLKALFQAPNGPWVDLLDSSYQEWLRIKPMKSWTNYVTVVGVRSGDTVEVLDASNNVLMSRQRPLLPTKAGDTLIVNARSVTYPISNGSVRVKDYAGNIVALQQFASIAAQDLFRVT